MLDKIDLHTHSCYSDGYFTPQQLIEYAQKHNVKLLALTDHDTVDGVAECQHYAMLAGMHFVTGLELSVNWRNHALHIVALDIDIENVNLKDLLQQQQLMRTQRAHIIAKKLAKLGVENALSKASKLTQGKVIARPHFAQVLIDEGVCKDMKSAFQRYLRRGRPAYQATNWVTLADGIKVIQDAGGVAVLAHPLRYKLTRTKLSELLTDFKDFGGTGMEVIAGLSSNDEISHLSTLCQKFDLVASVGSDFHGEKVTPHSMKQLKTLPNGCSSIVNKLSISALLNFDGEKR